MILSTSTTARAPSSSGGRASTRNHRPSRPPTLLLLRIVPRATGGGGGESDPNPKTATAKGGGAGESSSLGFKAAWVAAEALGNLVGKNATTPAATADATPSSSSSSSSTSSSSPMSREEILASIREDFAANYFLTGQGDMRAYADDCLYSDPFSAFRGTARFKKNVANFGAVVDAVRVDLGEIGADPSDPADGNVVAATWRFSGVVKVLPWRPVLAARGSTRHVIDPRRGLVVEHVEEWASSPGEVLARLWEPSNRGAPVNRWEAALGARKRGGWAAALKAAVEWKEDGAAAAP